MRKKLVWVSLYEIELIFQILELMLSEDLELNFIGKSQQPSLPPHVYSSTTAVALRLFLIGKRRRICSNNAMIISLEIRAGDPAFRIVCDTLLSTSFQSVRDKKEVWRALYYHTGAMSDGFRALWRTYMQCHLQAFLSACWKSLPHALSLVAEGTHEDGERGCWRGTQSMTPLANGCNALCGEECSHDWDRKDWPKSFTSPGCICCQTSGDDDGKSSCSYTTLLSLFVISLAELFACIVGFVECADKVASVWLPSVPSSPPPAYYWDVEAWIYSFSNASGWPSCWLGCWWHKTPCWCFCCWYEKNSVSQGS